jgi:integrase
METTYDVKIWAIEKRKWKSTTTYRVNWRVDKQPLFRHTFETYALADSFRSKLVSAARDGVAFDIRTGLPVTMLRTTNMMTWYEFARNYVDTKWRDASPGHRRSIAQSLTPITVAMTTTKRGIPEQKVLNRAIQVAFNPRTRNNIHPDEIKDALTWIANHSRDVADLAEPGVLREVLAAIDTKRDGKRASPNTIRLRRTTLSNAVLYAIEEKLLTKNPLDEVTVKKKNKNVLRQVDQRGVVNPVQGRSLLRTVAHDKPRLQAFFALMYFAGLRPEEAANLRKRNLSLPAEGWGEIYLEKATPGIGEEWTDSHTRSEERGLKHREDNAGRTVPCCPELTSTLQDHINAYGTASDGRLFWGQRNGGRIGSSVYGRAWAKARKDTFTSEVVDSPLAKRPYDLRHACVSTWLAAGVEPTRVAEWAGHSVSVLLRVYAKFLDQGEQAARKRVEEALRGI